MAGNQTPRSPTTRGHRDLSSTSEQPRQRPSPHARADSGGVKRVLTEAFLAATEEPQLAAPPPSQPSPTAGPAAWIAEPRPFAFVKGLSNNIQGITKPAIRRLARRGGVKRIPGIQYEETPGAVFLANLRREAVTNAENAGRHGNGSVTAMDVWAARDRLGSTQNGFDG